MSSRKSLLAASMKNKTTDAEAVGDEPTAEPGEGSAAKSPGLSLAPPPVEEVDDEAANETETETVAVSEQPEADVPERPDVAAPETAPEQSPPAPMADTPDPGTAEQPTTVKATQTARVVAGAGQFDLDEQPLTHLRAVIANGRDQRDYVRDLPRRSDKGTYVRLPVHLQDALREYCDPNDAPMADLVAAVLDGYFRDIGLLPPLGQGHRPNEKFLDKVRKQNRTYDY